MVTYLQNGYQDATPKSSSERIKDLMVQLARQGLNTSLRALQVWADLARQLGPQVLGCSTDGTRVFLAGDYNLFSKLLAAQRDTVDELVINYRELSQRYLDLR
jgi:kynureninase